LDETAHAGSSHPSFCARALSKVLKSKPLLVLTVKVSVVIETLVKICADPVSLQ